MLLSEDVKTSLASMVESVSGGIITDDIFSADWCKGDKRKEVKVVSMSSVSGDDVFDGRDCRNRPSWRSWFVVGVVMTFFGIVLF